MITIKYFAKIRETIQQDGQEIDYAPTMSSIQDVIDYLSTLSPAHDAALSDDNLMAALNEDYVPLTAAISDGDEIAFFPPMTGG